MPGLVFYLLVFLIVGVVFLFFHLMLGHFIRPNRPDDEKMTIYECGEPTVGSAWIQFDLRYYVVALLFVVFDVEVAFFFPWAVVFGKANELSNPGLDADKRAAITQQLVPADLNLIALHKEPAPAAEDSYAKKQTPASNPALGDGGKKKGGVGGKGGGKGGGKKGKGDAAANGQPEPGQPEPGKGGPAPGGGMLGPMPQPTAKSLPPEPIEPIDPATAKSWAWIAFGDIMIFFGVLMVGFAYLWRRGDINWVRSVAAESEV